MVKLFIKWAPGTEGIMPQCYWSSCEEYMDMYRLRISQINTNKTNPWTYWQSSSLAIHLNIEFWIALNWWLVDHISKHSVESSSTVDPQWDIWYWGSKWNLHTVCWSAVGCEWGTTSIYFGITYVCLIPSRLPVFAVEPQYLLQDFFIFGKSIIWRTHTKS